MICPSCSHTNPVGAVQCEACLTPLAPADACPSCGEPVLSDANFCGQCGARLRDPDGLGSMATFEAMPETLDAVMETLGSSPRRGDLGADVFPEAVAEAPEPAAPVAEDLAMLAGEHPGDLEALGGLEAMADLDDLDDGGGGDEAIAAGDLGELFAAEVQRPLNSAAIEAAIRNDALAVLAEASPPGAEGGGAIAPLEGPTTKIQQHTARLLHLQTDRAIALPAHLLLIHIGKANNRVPPDIDLSGFPHAEVVSRIHADIRCEGGVYYLEDSGSANGTYVNNMPLPVGNRHRLRPGDRISLGKHDLVSFLFQLD